MDYSGTVHKINVTLKTLYGCNDAGKPIFRVVYSDTQTEKRFGVFNEFYGSIFIREIRGLREVPKYPYIKDKWILERWLPPEKAYTDEIPATREGSHEPVFVFQDDKFEPLPVVEEIVLRIIWNLLHPSLPGHQMSDWKEQEKKELEQEIAHNVEVLSEEGRTWIGHRLHSGEAIIKP